MGDVLFVWTAVSNRLSNMFGMSMRTGLAQRLVSIDTVSCLRTSLVQYFKIANKEEALLDAVEIETEEMPSCVRKQSTGKEMERRRNRSFD